MHFFLPFLRATGAVALLLAGATASAGDTGNPGTIQIEAPWARSTIGTSKTGAIYLKIINSGENKDRLVAIDTPVAAKAHLHKTIADANMMKMRPVDNLIVKPGSTTVLAPGGMHIMLMQLSKPLEKGRSFPLTLHFETGGNVTVTVPIGGPGRRQAPE